MWSIIGSIIVIDNPVIGHWLFFPLFQGISGFFSTSGIGIPVESFGLFFPLVQEIGGNIFTVLIDGKGGIFSTSDCQIRISWGRHQKPVFQIYK